MFHVPEGFLNLKAVVVDPDNLDAAATEVIGEDVSGLIVLAIFSRTDDP